MNRSQLLNKFAEDNELTRKEADGYLTSLVDIITANRCDWRRRCDLRLREVPADRSSRPPRAEPSDGRDGEGEGEARRAHHAAQELQGRRALGQGARRRRRPPRRRWRRRHPPRKAPAKKAPAKKAAAKKAAKKAPARKTPREASLNCNTFRQSRSWARAECPGPLAFTLPRRATSVRAVELFRIRLPLSQPFRTARSTTTHKDALLVRVVTDDARRLGRGRRRGRAHVRAGDARHRAARRCATSSCRACSRARARRRCAGTTRPRAALATARCSTRELRVEGVSLAAHLGGHAHARRRPASRSAATTDADAVVARRRGLRRRRVPQPEAEDRARSRRRAWSRRCAPRWART